MSSRQDGPHSPHGDSPVVFFDFMGTLARREGATLRIAPGVRRLLATAARRGVLCNLPASLDRDDVLRVIADAGLDSSFDPSLVLDAYALGFPLPDRRAFGMAAAAAERSRCVFVSADPAARIGAAIAGWSTVSVDAAVDVRETPRDVAPSGDEPRLLADDGPTVTAAAPEPGMRYVLRGRVVRMNGASDVYDDGLVLVHDGRITRVLRQGTPLPHTFASAPTIDTEGTIYPGLIDLHNHFVYNVLPLWVVPKKYDNRSQWPRHHDYRSGVSMPIRQALAKYTVSAEAIVRYVEAKALLAGTTTGQGILTRVEGGTKLFRGAMRNVERPSSDRLPAARTRVPDLSVTGQSGPDNIESFRRGLEATAEIGAAYFYHLSEGVDASARRHFLNLLDNDLIGPSLVGIHALALEPQDLRIMAENDARIVWSPFSNQLLYSKTLDLNAVLEAGVKLCLGCDWSPSGSKNLLQELKVAAWVNEQQGSPLSKEQLVRLVTADAARITGWQSAVGMLKQGAEADFVVIRGKGGDPYAHLIEATEADVDLVTVAGRPRYGYRPLVEALHAGPSTDLERLEIGGRDKAFFLRAEGSPINHVSFEAARSILTDAMDDLPKFVEDQKAAEADTLALGVARPQRFVLELDNEFSPDGDPLLDLDMGEAEPGLFADVEMQKSIPLDGHTVDKGDDDYWKRIEEENNIKAELKAHLRKAYGLPDAGSPVHD